MSKQAFFEELRGEMGELAEYIVQGVGSLVVPDTAKKGTRHGSSL